VIGPFWFYLSNGDGLEVIGNDSQGYDTEEMREGRKTEQSLVEGILNKWVSERALRSSNAKMLYIYEKSTGKGEIESRIIGK